MADDSDATRKSPNMTVSWRGVALGMTVSAASSLATLVIVATVSNTDVLSTIALALAILAFSAQLVIALAQGLTSTQQMLQSERVNTDTHALLSEVRATVESLLATSREQFGMVLKSALQRAEEVVEQEVQDDGDVTATARKEAIESVREALQTAFAERLPITAQAAPSRAAAPRASPAQKDAADSMGLFPETAEEGEPLYRRLRALSAAAAGQLSRTADFERSQLSRGDEPGGFIRRLGNPAIDELVRAGLMQVVAPPPHREGEARGRQFVRLTDDGREVARVVIGRGAYPGWLVELMRQDAAERSA